MFGLRVKEKEKVQFFVCFHLQQAYDCACKKANVHQSVKRRSRESDRETQRQMGLLQAWISRREEWALMCGISRLSISHHRDGVCLTQEWLIYLSSPHLEHRRNPCLSPHTCARWSHTPLMEAVQCLTPLQWKSHHRWFTHQPNTLNHVPMELEGLASFAVWIIEKRTV